MAVTFALTAQTPHLLRYLVTSGGAEAGNLDGTGAVTPDLITDSIVGSPMAGVMGATYAAAANVQTALLEGNTIDIWITPRTAAALWIIEGALAGATTHPRLTMTAAAIDVLGCILTIRYLHTETR